MGHVVPSATDRKSITESGRSSQSSQKVTNINYPEVFVTSLQLRNVFQEPL